MNMAFTTYRSWWAMEPPALGALVGVNLPVLLDFSIPLSHEGTGCPSIGQATPYFLELYFLTRLFGHIRTPFYLYSS
jgi:hypothetical protein